MSGPLFALLHGQPVRPIGGNDTRVPNGFRQTHPIFPHHATRRVRQLPAAGSHVLGQPWRPLRPHWRRFLPAGFRYFAHRRQR